MSVITSYSIHYTKLYEEEPVSPEAFRAACEATEGITVMDKPEEKYYPLPLHIAGKDDVYVGRIRKDLTNRNNFV